MSRSTACILRAPLSGGGGWRDGARELKRWLPEDDASGKRIVSCRGLRRPPVSPGRARTPDAWRPREVRDNFLAAEAGSVPLQLAKSSLASKKHASAERFPAVHRHVAPQRRDAIGRASCDQAQQMLPGRLQAKGNLRVDRVGSLAVGGNQEAKALDFGQSDGKLVRQGSDMCFSSIRREAPQLATRSTPMSVLSPPRPCRRIRVSHDAKTKNCNWNRCTVHQHFGMSQNGYGV